MSKSFTLAREVACFDDVYEPMFEGDIAGSGGENEKSNSGEFIVDFDELVDCTLEANQEEDGLIDVHDLVDDLFARDREEYERTHMCEGAVRQRRRIHPSSRRGGP